MTREWLLVRLHAPAGAGRIVPPAVTRAARLFASSDPDSCVFFDRTDDPDGSGVAVWISADAAARRVAAQPLVSDPLPPGWTRSVVHGATRPAGNGHESDLDDELAAVSTELAVSVLESHRPADDLTLALAHLRGVAGLAAPTERAGVLFHCWQHFSADLTPQQRVALTARASVHEAAAAPAPGVAMQRYLTRTRHLAANQRSGTDLPTGYLLFSQATHTQHRLGIAPDRSALATLLVRAESTAAQHAPLSMSGRTA